MRTLHDVNRLLLEAIEEPPDTGEEERLDELAATLWARAERQQPLDPGTNCRLRHKLRTIAEGTHEARASRLRRARELLDEHAAAHPPRGRA